MKLSDRDDFGLPCHIAGREGIRVVDNAENIRLDVLLDDANFLSFVSELSSSEQFFKSSDVLFDSKLVLSEVFDFFSCS